ncbi:MAG: thiamine phosphate synthase [Phycisphaeraceae bacterium]|nr:thiamine phosphate synthase [Phycisphaeraceae bacterium]
MTTPQRIIDANANRVREAMRVLEEAARFVLEDESLSLQLKQMRHDFTAALPDTLGLVAHRDTPGDVGTTLTTDAEQSRSGLTEVIAAASGRLSEALRAIEEYSKLDELGPAYQPLAQAAEQVRYQSYDVTQKLTLALNKPSTQWRLCLLLTQSLCTHHDWRRVLQHAVKSGADCIQVREKDMDAGPLLEHTREIVALVGGRAAVIVNDRPDLAVLAGADGVHLGQTDLNPADARKIVGPRMLIGVSTSSLDQAEQAKADGADYCGVGPMFPTTTKHKPDLAGPTYLRGFVQWDGLPHLVIGGVTPTNIRELVEAGGRGVAVSSAICSAEDPAAVTASLCEALQATTANK